MNSRGTVLGLSSSKIVESLGWTIIVKSKVKREQK